MMPRPIFRKTPLLFLSLFATLGILVQDYARFSEKTFLFIFFVSIACLFLKKIRLTGFLILIFLLFAGVQERQLRHLENFPFYDTLHEEKSLLIEGEARLLRKPFDSKYQKMRVIARLHKVTHKGQEYSTNQRIFLRIPSPPPPAGSIIKFWGRMELAPQTRNPKEVNMREFSFRRNIACDISISDKAHYHWEKGGMGGWLYASTDETRQWIRNTLTRGIVGFEKERDILLAMLLGEKQSAEEELLDTFRYSGAMHLFAVSGLHVGMIALIFWFIFQFFRLPRGVQTFSILALLIIYTYVTGLRASAVRASIMAGFFLLAPLCNRRGNLLNYLGASALCILFFDPQQVFQLGAQLSFSVLFSIALVSPRITRWSEKWTDPDDFIPHSLLKPSEWNFWQIRVWAMGLVIVSVSAWIGSAFFIFIHFNLTTPVSVLANCLLVPLTFCILMIAFLSLLFSGIQITFFSVLCNHTNILLLKSAFLGAQFFAQLPGGHFLMQSPLRADNSITIFDTPEGGEAAHIVLDNKDYLLDSGTEFFAKWSLKRYFNMKGISSLEQIILTHADGKHIGGTAYLLDLFPKTTLATHQTRNNSSLWKSLQKTTSKQKKLLALPTHKNNNEPSFQILHPPPNYPKKQADESSLTLLLHCPPWKILFINDATPLTLRAIQKKRPKLSADILIASDPKDISPLLEEWIAYTKPKSIILGRPYHPQNKPSEKFKRSLSRKNISLFEQEDTGAVEINFSPNQLSLTTFIDQKTEIITVNSE